MGKPNKSPRSAAFRHGRILQGLERDGEVRAASLASEFGVSLMTVWRDLGNLAEQGLLERVHGGARPPARKSFEAGFEAKEVENAPSKNRIAAVAVERFVTAGDCVAMEGGTTVAALVEHLPESNLSIVTNSLPVALRIRASRPTLPVRLLGGWLSGISGNTIGGEALREVATSASSVCFLGASAWDADSGPMDPNPMEIEIKRALAAAATRVVLLMDGSKFGQRSASVLLHPRRIHALVTDREPPRKIQRQLRADGVEWILAE
jgi:DeoR/GlpR family transcriptional regulator of sugar metabolism